MSDTTGLIFDIQSHSIHDGPGTRTTIFMSGCRLSCRWCANPESWQAYEKILYSEMRCTVKQGCRTCISHCSLQAINLAEGKLILDRTRCQECKELRCTEHCHQQALKHCGHCYSVEDLLQRLQHDQNYWGEEGGVTFSGGDPFFQHRFLSTLANQCHRTGIHTAVETTAYIRTEIFLDAMQAIDFAFIDVKHMDNRVHQQYTGVGNSLILKNIEAISLSDWQGRLILRMPVIAGFNDGFDNMQSLADFMERVKIYEINLLPYHRLGESKWLQLGKKYSEQELKAPTHQHLAEIKHFFNQKKLACYVGSNTPF
ncbi:TPA: 4-hydroxyphenylacetate decarboxylase activase [Yersinia enterocolitica]